MRCVANQRFERARETAKWKIPAKDGGSRKKAVVFVERARKTDFIYFYDLLSGRDLEPGVCCLSFEPMPQKKKSKQAMCILYNL